jgi:membrane associated rhomboid family serine protease
MQPVNKSLNVIVGLIIANVIMYLITMFGPGMKDVMFNTFALYYPQNEHFRYWQLVTTMFMHSDSTWMHIIFNMYGLWAFGTPLLELWGGKRFLFFYFLSGIGASAIYILMNYLQFNAMYDQFLAAGISVKDIQHLLNTGTGLEPFAAFPEEKVATFFHLFNTPAVGASGAIYGVLVAFGMTYPNAKLALIFLPVPIAAKFFIPALILMDLFSGVTGVSIFGGGVAHFAHIGGAIIGFLLMWSWRKTVRVPPHYYTDGTEHS